MLLWGKNNKLCGRDEKLLMGSSTSEKTYDPVLENNSWADIQEALRNGNPVGWKAGDIKKVMLSDGNTYTARLVDLNKGRYKDINDTTNGGVIIYSDGDKVFVGAHSELFNASTAKSRAYQTEIDLYPQWDYYKTNDTNSARIKKLLDSTNDIYYWNRSPFYGSDNAFCAVYVDGTTFKFNTYYGCGLAPVFVL